MKDLDNDQDYIFRRNIVFCGKRITKKKTRHIVVVVLFFTLKINKEKTQGV